MTVEKVETLDAAIPLEFLDAARASAGASPMNFALSASPAAFSAAGRPKSRPSYPSATRLTSGCARRYDTIRDGASFPIEVIGRSIFAYGQFGHHCL